MPTPRELHDGPARGFLLDDHAIDASVAAHRAYWQERHEDRVVDKAIEEFAELTKELLKRRYEGGDAHPNAAARLADIRGELMDLMICCEFLARGLGFTRAELDAGLRRLAGKVERRCRDDLAASDSDVNPIRAALAEIPEEGLTIVDGEVPPGGWPSSGSTS